MGIEIGKDITMNVSCVVGKEGEKKIYVLFSDRDKSAEFVLPDLKLLKNTGFSDEEADKLKDYLDSERSNIFSIAKDVDPMKAFLGL